MYMVGDKVVYPMHGAGVIEAIEEKEILGKRQAYYIMRTCTGSMTVMIPMQNSQQVGMRDVISKEEAKKVLETFRSAPISDDENWNKRQRDNMIKIKSGDIYQVLGVLKDLMYREKSKGLSTSERKMLGNAKQIVVSELVLSTVADEGDIETIIEDTIDELL